MFLAYVVNGRGAGDRHAVLPEEALSALALTVLAEAADHRRSAGARRRLLPTSKVNVASSYLEGFETEPVKWKASRDAIRQMRDLSRAAGASYPPDDEPDFNQELDDRYAIRANRDAVTDLGRRDEPRDRRLVGPTSVLRTMGDGWVPWDGHPNAEDHRRIAEFEVTRILEQFGGAE